MKTYRMIAVLCGSIALCRVSDLWTREQTAAQLSPDTTIGYVEITDTAAIMSVLYDHPLNLHIQEMDAWKAAREKRWEKETVTETEYGVFA